MPILVRELPPRFVAKQNPVVAGPKPSSAISAPGSSGIFANGLGGNDPWANWSGTSANTGQPPRAAAGPIEDKFAKQTSRMDKLEAELTQIKQDQKEQKESQAKFQQDVVAGDQENRKDLDQKIVGLKQEFENSFTKALATQTKKFDNDLQEIKQLLLGSAKRKEHPDTMMTWQLVWEATFLGFSVLPVWFWTFLFVCLTEKELLPRCMRINWTKIGGSRFFGGRIFPNWIFYAWYLVA